MRERFDLMAIEVTPKTTVAHFEAPKAANHDVAMQLYSHVGFNVYLLAGRHESDETVKIPIAVNVNTFEYRKKISGLRGVEVVLSKSAELCAAVRFEPVGSPEMSPEPADGFVFELPKPSMEEMIRREIRKAVPIRHDPTTPAPSDEDDAFATDNYEVDDDDEIIDPLERAPEHLAETARSGSGDRSGAPRAAAPERVQRKPSTARSDLEPGDDDYQPGDDHNEPEPTKPVEKVTRRAATKP